MNRSTWKLGKKKKNPISVKRLLRTVLHLKLFVLCKGSGGGYFKTGEDPHSVVSGDRERLALGSGKRSSHCAILDAAWKPYEHERKNQKLEVGCEVQIQCHTRVKYNILRLWCKMYPFRIYNNINMSYFMKTFSWHTMYRLTSSCFVINWPSNRVCC